MREDQRAYLVQLYGDDDEARSEVELVESELPDLGDHPISAAEIVEFEQRSGVALPAELVEFLKIIGMAGVTDQDRCFPLIDWLDEHYWLPPEREPSEDNRAGEVGGYTEAEWQVVLARHCRENRLDEPGDRIAKLRRHLFERRCLRSG